MWRQEPVRSDRIREAFERAGGKSIEEESGGALPRALRDHDGLGLGDGDEARSSTSMWVLAGISTFVLVGLLTVLAYLPPGKGRRPSPGRKAALLGVAAATGFGFVVAVIKELSSHLSQGPSGVFLNWSPYVLLLSGAAAMFLASNAFQAGSLAASQPGLTIVDPLVASALGVVLFGERLNHAPAAFIGEILAVALLVISVVVLSRSPLVHDEREDESPPAELASAADGRANGERVSFPLGVSRTFVDHARSPAQATRAQPESSGRF
jgi:hypothetical protein